MISTLKHNIQNTFTVFCQLLFVVALATTSTVRTLTAKPVRQLDVAPVGIMTVVLPELPAIDLTVRHDPDTGRLLTGERKKVHYIKNNP
jgi:hypothetical protein